MIKSLVAFFERYCLAMGLSFSKENGDKFNRYTLASQAYEAIKHIVYIVRQIGAQLMVCHFQVV